MTVHSGPLRIRYCRPATAVASSVDSSTAGSYTINNSIAGMARDGIANEARANQSVANRAVGEPSCRVAYALSKKLGSAVVRNRLRRQIRAILTDLAAQNTDFFPAGDYLVGLQPSPQAKGSTTAERKQVHAWGYHQLSEHIHTALGKLQARLSEAPN